MLSVFRLQSICNAYQKLQRNFFLPFPCYGSIFCGLKNGLEIVQMRLHVGFWLNLFFIFVFFSQWMCISCRNALLLGIIRITCIWLHGVSNIHFNFFTGIHPHRHRRCCCFSFFSVRWTFPTCFFLWILKLFWYFSKNNVSKCVPLQLRRYKNWALK